MNCTAPTVTRSPLRRLIRFEINNTVRDLLGVATNPADALPGEETGNGFGNDADSLGVSALLIDGYRTLARDIALAATKDAGTAATTAGCDPTKSSEAACSAQFIGAFGPKAYRRPLAAADTTFLNGVFTKGRMLGNDFASGIRAIIEVVLQSPQFLYKVELGQPAPDVGAQFARPSPYEMASRLSYLFWGTMPDAALVTAAQQGKLGTRDEVLAQAKRLLADPRSHQVVRFFHEQLYGTRGLDTIQKNTQAYPSFISGTASLLREETAQFVDYVVFQGAGDLGTLYTAPYTFLNDALAKFYGVTGVTGATFQKVDLDATRRKGVFSQAGFLALTTPGTRTNPVIRGKTIYEKVLCGQVSPPPPGLMVKEPDPMPGATTRQRYEAHRTQSACAACHIYLDPLGFAFEHFDGVGLWRDLDNGLPIDDSAHIEDTDAKGDFQGAVALADRLASSQDARECYVGKWLTYGYGRGETPADACVRASLETAFAKAGGNVQELMLALTQTDAFLYRPASP
jgi:hypothetical protein